VEESHPKEVEYIVVPATKSRGYASAPAPTTKIFEIFA
jgi:hypothetical protein